MDESFFSINDVEGFLFFGLGVWIFLDSSCAVTQVLEVSWISGVSIVFVGALRVSGCRV